MTKGKYKIEDKKKFVTAIFLLVVIILVITLIVMNISNKNLIPSNNKKVTQSIFNKKQIKKMYNQDKELFIQTHKEMQEKISMWLLSNLTKEADSFEKNVKEANKYLSNKDYSKLSLDKNKIDYWIGDFVLDNTGKLTFKFGSKGILPNWINDSDIKNIVL